MKLVGASWSFIRRPFLRSAVCVGVIAAILANIVLGACFYALYLTQPGILSIVGWEELTITGCAVLLFGVLITLLCAYASINRFLRMKAGDLYYI
jgi:cell division transport system permease protein